MPYRHFRRAGFLDDGTLAGRKLHRPSGRRRAGRSSIRTLPHSFAHARPSWDPGPTTVGLLPHRIPTMDEDLGHNAPTYKGGKRVRRTIFLLAAMALVLGFVVAVTTPKKRD